MNGEKNTDMVPYKFTSCDIAADGKINSVPLDQT